MRKGERGEERDEEKCMTKGGRQRRRGELKGYEKWTMIKKRSVREEINRERRSTKKKKKEMKRRKKGNK